jgi:hypothetical protein
MHSECYRRYDNHLIRVLIYYSSELVGCRLHSHHLWKLRLARMCPFNAPAGTQGGDSDPRRAQQRWREEFS